MKPRNDHLCAIHDGESEHLGSRVLATAADTVRLQAQAPSGERLSVQMKPCSPCGGPVTKPASVPVWTHRA